MIPLGQGATPFDRRVEAALVGVPEWHGAALRYELAAAPLASPTHRAMASDCVRVAVAGQADLFLKIRHPDMKADLGPGAAEGALKAGRLGVGPAVRIARDGILALDYLPPPWRSATVGDLQDEAVMQAVLQAKRRLHADALLGWAFCPFARIAALAAEAQAVCAPMPDGAARMVAATALIREAVEASGIDRRFCQNDGIASNIMLGDEGVRLVDFDLAGDADPWFEIGALINEACEFDPERRAVIEMFSGRCDERLFHRARLYGAVDDVMWGLWGVTRAITSRRGGIEFFKYGQWRLFHARTTLGARDFETWLRRL